MVDTGKIVYTLKSGEKVALPQGNPINVSDRVLVHPTPDGRFITTGNNGITTGDKVIVLTTNAGEQVSVNVKEEAEGDHVWAYLVPYKNHVYRVYHASPSINQMVYDIKAQIPPCKAITLEMDYEVFTTDVCNCNVYYTLESTNMPWDDPIMVGTVGFDTFLNVIGAQNIAFFYDMYGIPVTPASSSVSFFGYPEGADIPGGWLSVAIPMNTLETSEQVNDNMTPPPLLNYYYFPPNNFHGVYSIKLMISKADYLANPERFELI